MKGLLITAAATALLAGQAQAKVLTVTPGGDVQEKPWSCPDRRQAGRHRQDIAAGRYDLTDGLSLDVANVTVKGAGPDATILSFKGQKSSGEGAIRN